MFHIFLHFLIPAIVTGLFFRRQWKTAYLTMMMTMAVDIDHLLATPIYDPERCSIGFHPLHTLFPIILYGVMSLIPKTRLIGLGLVIHMVLDAFDCDNWPHIIQVLSL